MTLSGKLRRAGIAVAFISVATTAVPAFGDENPFVPVPPEDLSKPLPEGAVRMIVEQAVADAEHRMREQFDAERRMMMDSIARISARHASARPAPGTPTGSGDVVDPENPIATPELAPLIPERAKFVACVNGKSLYRDPEGISFLSEVSPAPGVDSCSE